MVRRCRGNFLYNKIEYVLLVYDLIFSTRDKVTCVLESSHDSPYLMALVIVQFQNKSTINGIYIEQFQN